MKAIIENPVVSPLSNSHTSNCFHTALEYFNEILNIVTTSNSGEELYQNMKENIYLEQMAIYFKHGWGCSHFWVKQIVDGEVKQ